MEAKNLDSEKSNSNGPNKKDGASAPSPIKDPLKDGSKNDDAASDEMNGASAPTKSEDFFEKSSKKPGDASAPPTESETFDEEARRIKAEAEAERIAEEVLANEARRKMDLQGPNKVQNKYMLTDANHVWVSDWTIGHGGNIYILLVVDLTTRLILSTTVLDKQL